MALKFRRWWQPARKASAPHEDRTVSFLELFYDLAYVVLVAEIAHALAAHPDLKGLGTFAFLFGIVWWAWMNGTWYHEFHGNNDIRTRIFTFLQMGAIAGMAVFAHNAMGEGSAGFALFFALFQLIACVLYWRLAVHDPEHHIGNRPFVLFFTFSTILFFISIFVPTPFRFYIWFFAVLVSLLQPLLSAIINPSLSSGASGVQITPAFIERFGLFNILVLAEIIVGVVRGLSHHHHLSIPVFAVGGLGLCLAFAMWWLYFDFVAHRKPIATSTTITTWLYMHLFIGMSIVATGAIVLKIVEHAGEGLEPTTRWFLVGAVSVFLLSITVLMRVIQVIPTIKSASNTASILIFIAAIIIALLGLTSLATIPLLITILTLMMVPVVYAVVIWVKVLDAGDVHGH